MSIKEIKCKEVFLKTSAGGQTSFIKSETIKSITYYTDLYLIEVVSKNRIDLYPSEQIIKFSPLQKIDLAKI